MDAAFRQENPGAVEIIAFCLSLRSNPRSRRSVWHARQEWLRRHRVGYVHGVQAWRDWYAELG